MLKGATFRLTYSSINPKSNALKHIKGLDTLRAYAVILVIIGHWGPNFYADPNARRRYFIQHFFVPDASFGVTLFFVLSGFLITSILLNARDSADSNGTKKTAVVRNFFSRRALRIFPIYYILIAFLYAINMGDVRANIAYALTYTMNILCYRTNAWNSISHTWTLGIEEQFYLLWPWLILFISYRYMKRVLICIVIIGAISSYIVVEQLGHMMPFLVFNSFDAFGLGALYAFARVSPYFCHKFERSIWWLVPPAFAVYFYWKVLHYNGLPLGPGISFSKTVNSIISVWLIMLILNCKSARMNRYILENKVLNYIGRISYGLYLFHPPFAVLMMPILRSFIARTALQFPAFRDVILSYTVDYWVCIFTLIAVASLSYYLIEKPFLKLKALFRYRDIATKKQTGISV